MNPSHRGAARVFLRTDGLGLQNPACLSTDLAFLRKGETSRLMMALLPLPSYPSSQRRDKNVESRCSRREDVIKRVSCGESVSRVA